MLLLYADPNFQINLKGQYLHSLFTYYLILTLPLQYYASESNLAITFVNDFKVKGKY
jgi:hypothetical protein